ALRTPRPATPRTISLGPTWSWITRVREASPIGKPPLPESAQRPRAMAAPIAADDPQFFPRDDRLSGFDAKSQAKAVSEPVFGSTCPHSAHTRSGQWKRSAKK